MSKSIPIEPIQMGLSIERVSKYSQWKWNKIISHTCKWTPVHVQWLKIPQNVKFFANFYLLPTELILFLVVDMRKMLRNNTIGHIRVCIRQRITQKVKKYDNFDLLRLRHTLSSTAICKRQISCSRFQTYVYVDKWMWPYS